MRSKVSCGAIVCVVGLGACVECWLVFSDCSKLEQSSLLNRIGRQAQDKSLDEQMMS